MNKLTLLLLFAFIALGVGFTKLRAHRRPVPPLAATAWHERWSPAQRVHALDTRNEVAAEVSLARYKQKFAANGAAALRGDDEPLIVKTNGGNLQVKRLEKNKSFTENGL